MSQKQTTGPKPIQLTRQGIRTLAESMGLKLIPCAPGTKIPLTRNGFRASQQEIEKAFAENSDANIAVAAGAASGGAVDLDFERGEVARRFFAKFEQLLARTWVIATPHGGIGVLVRAVDSIPVRRIRPAGEEILFDVCGEGGYFLVYGTINHSRCDPAKTNCPHTGSSSYRTISFDYRIMEMSRIEESLRRRCGELGWKWNDKAWPTVRETANGVGEGERNKAAFVHARYLLFTLNMRPDDALAALRVWNARNRPPLSDSELSQVVASARNYPRDKPDSDRAKIVGLLR